MRRPKGLPHGGGKPRASSPLPHDAGDTLRRLEGTLATGGGSVAANGDRGEVRRLQNDFVKR